MDCLKSHFRRDELYESPTDELSRAAQSSPLRRIE